jgi:rubrerythrin
MKGGQGKRDRQEAAIIRTEATILAYEEKLKSDEKDDEKKLLKKKIERAQSTVKNTKERKK